MKAIAICIVAVMTTSVSICCGQTLRKAEHYYQRGLARQEQGDVEGAIADFSKAIEMLPKYSAAYGSRGAAKKARGDMRALFSKTIEIDPKYAKANADRGLARLNQSLDTEAQKDFDKYLELNSSMKASLEQRIKYARYQRDKKRKPIA